MIRIKVLLQNTLKIAFFSSFLFIPSLAFSQNNLKDSFPKYKFSLGFSNYYVGTFEHDNKNFKVKIPNKPFFLQRRFREKDLQERWNLFENYSTDDPLFHGAFSLSFHVHSQITKSISLEGRAVFEDRGFSYGAYNPEIMAIFPQIKLKYHKGFLLKNDSLILKFDFGNFVDFRFGEGLTLYNIDLQGDITNLRFKNFNLKFLHVYDLYQSIGLNINDAFHLGLFYEPKYSESASEKMRFRLGVIHVKNTPTSEPPFSDENNNTIDATAALYKKGSFRIYTQESYRYNGYGNDFTKKSSALLGLQFEKNMKRVSFDLRMEARYYGIYYNAWFINTNVYYRNPDKEDMGNFIGTSLYPLERYDRPYSQWAAYTFYNFTSIAGISFQGKCDIPLYKKLSLQIKPDLNYIAWPDSIKFFLPFMQAGLYYHEPKKFDIFVGLTNKGMNLDNRYPDFYLYKQPYIYFRIRKLLENKSDIVREN